MKHEFGEYELAGCFDEEAAEELDEAGITPYQVATFTDESVGIGHYRDTIGYKFANKDLSLDDVKKLIKEVA